MKICKQCKIEYEDNMKFCPECGSKLEAKLNVCPNCGMEYVDGQKFCSECGAKIVGNPNQTLLTSSTVDIEELFQKGLKICENEENDSNKSQEMNNYFTIAAKAGHILSMYYLGLCYMAGDFDEDYKTNYKDWQKKLTEAESKEEMFKLADFQPRVCVESQTTAFGWYLKAAEAGYIEAQNKLGDCYLYGKGVEQDGAKAIEWYTKAANSGHTEALYKIAECYEYGKGVEQDGAKAIEWYTKVANAGHSEALYKIAECYELGMGIDEDKSKAIEWYTKAANSGYAEAQYELGNIYYQSYCQSDYWGDEIDEDMSKAVEWYTKAANSGHAEAQYELGKIYHAGIGIAKNEELAYKLFKKASECEYVCSSTLRSLGDALLDLYDEKSAFECYKRAAEEGDEDSKKTLTNFKSDGTLSAEGIFNKCWKENKHRNNIKWLKRAADAGYLDAVYELGNLYSYGYYGINEDVQSALALFMQAAEAGHIEAMFKLAWCYRYDEKVGRNHKLAREWLEKAANSGDAEAQYVCAEYYREMFFDSNVAKMYRKAAEQGLKEAQYKLGVCYERGTWVEKNIYTAFQWYEKAAEAGDPDAQYCVGCCYYFGKGVNRDFGKSESWLNKGLNAKKETYSVKGKTFWRDYKNEDFQKMLDKVKEDKARYEANASNTPNSFDNFAVDKCVPYVFFIKAIGIDVALPNGKVEHMTCGTGGNMSGWSGTGMLLNDGRFVTARHVVEPWSFCMTGGEADETQLGLNIIANNGGKVVARFNAISSTGVQLSFTSDQCTINRWNDKTTLVKDGKKIVMATLDNTDYAYFNSGRSNGLPFNTKLSTKLVRGTKLEVLGFPLGLGANSATDINPIYGSGIVSVSGLQNGVILTTDTNYEQGNSGGPVFKANPNGVLEVIGLVSAGAGRVTGFIVPIEAVKQGTSAETIRSINKENNEEHTLRDKKNETKTKVKETKKTYIEGHEYVDLGLPSGTRWATCNIGASKSEEYGEYYSWGETKEYSPNNCKYGSSAVFWLKFRGIVDSNGNLTSSFDVAKHKWGGSWHLPNRFQIEELINNTTRIWTVYNGVNGILVTSKSNGNSIFLPAAGIRKRNGISDAGNRGEYLGATIDSINHASCLKFYNKGIPSLNDFYSLNDFCDDGHTVRPVSNSK